MRTSGPSSLASRIGAVIRARRRLIGVVALGSAAIYATIVAAASRSMDHLVDQARADAPFLIPIFIASGIQVALLVELHRQRTSHGAGTAATAAGLGASTVGMLACCAHHIADLIPFLGLSVAAPFVFRYRVVFMLFGLAGSALGIAIGGRRLAPPEVVGTTEEVDLACASL